MDSADLLIPEYRAAAIKVLFGSTGRFALASWLLSRENPEFRLSDYGAETGHRMVSAGHLAQFLQMGMVTRVVPLPPQTPWYRRQPSPLWQVYAVALDILGDPVAAENEQLKSDLLKMLARHAEGGDA